MNNIYIIIWILLLISFIWFFVVLFWFNNNNFKNRIFFLLGILSFIAISIFSLSLIFLVSSWKITFQDYSLILTKWDVQKIEIKDKPSFYLSWEILSWTTFNWIVYELQWNNFIKQNNNWTWIDLSNYISKSDIKDFYMDSYNKRIEWMQNQINVFLTIITIIWTLLLFLWYKSANLIEEKVSQKIDDYFKKGKNWKKIIDDKIKEYIEWEWSVKIDEIIKNYLAPKNQESPIDKKIDSWIENNIQDTEIYKLISNNYLINDEELYKLITEQIFDELIKQKIKDELNKNKKVWIIWIMFWKIKKILQLNDNKK